jgi:hypothetical protein
MDTYHCGRSFSGGRLRVDHSTSRKNSAAFRQAVPSHHPCQVPLADQRVSLVLKDARLSEGFFLEPFLKLILDGKRETGTCLRTPLSRFNSST